MEPDESRLSARERLAKDAQREATLLRNILHFSFWTLAALIPTTVLLLVDMPLVARIIMAALCIVCWAFALGGMFRLTGLLDAGSRPVSLNPFHAGKQGTKDNTRT
ncbi:MAG: hypothetical protein JO015_04215 [Verrucomicrobia bacterium]|nr:hypothetical protein [Verrucomicrobiota bacterium]